MNHSSLIIITTLILILFICPNICIVVREENENINLPNKNSTTYLCPIGQKIICQCDKHLVECSCVDSHILDAIAQNKFKSLNLNTTCSSHGHMLIGCYGPLNKSNLYFQCDNKPN